MFLGWLRLGNMATVTVNVDYNNCEKEQSAITANTDRLKRLPQFPLFACVHPPPSAIRTWLRSLSCQAESGPLLSCRKRSRKPNTMGIITK